tara:strand:- start:46 stop:651 length:606 start_codon:yes stop_codon:yes gene_type:complete
MELDIRYAVEDDLSYIDHLQKKNAEDLSFYPKVVFEREAKNNRILLALVNNQHAGYLYHGSILSHKPLKIHQACIEYDLRGNWYGAGLVGTLEDIGKISYVDGISLRCGSDISANNFWQLMGFNCIDIQAGGVRRMRDINVWFKQLTTNLFGDKPSIILQPSTKKKDASFWKKRNKNKTQNSMLRGKALLRYRKEVLEESD